ncbi:MAG: right-handed parallel beta-helix repeat-containing protein [Clostridia bacterium]|nr:right-handed parallel beta-helix repeat-containing protein [Clostridia bacterium]
MLQQKIMSVLTAIITLLSLWLFPAKSEEGVFTEPASFEKTAFDEGEFAMGTYDLVVSPDGNDANAGTLAGPLQTLAGAKEKLKNAGIPDGESVTVWFKEGSYLISEAVTFDASDRANVVYRSVPGEDVVFTGSTDLTEWTQGEINGMDALVADVDTDSVYFRSLFKGETRLPVSTWPKEGAFHAVNALDSDALQAGNEFFKLHCAFYVNTDEIMNFANFTDVNVRIMHKWCDDILPLRSLDTESGRIELAKAAAMSIVEGDNFVYENVREAVSQPGEWYLDRSEGKLYYIPCEGETAESLVLSAPVTDALIRVDGVSGIQFNGIRFVNTDWDFANGDLRVWPMDETNPHYNQLTYLPTHPQASYEIPAAIEVKNAQNIGFVNCVFRSISNSAVMFKENVKNSFVQACYFDEIGGNAVFINAPHRIPAVTSGISVTDCEINEYGRIYNHSIGVLLCHADNCVIANNEIHDGWYTAVSVGWVWGYGKNPTHSIQVKDNLIYNIGNGWLSDMGGIYTLGIQPNTVLSGNVIYNVGCYDGKDGYGGWGIYLDEGSTQITVKNNLVYDCSSQTFHQHYGRNNIIRNNIFAFGKDGAFIVTRNEDHNSLFLQNNILVTNDAVMFKNCVDENWFIDHDNLLWDYARKSPYSGAGTGVTDRKSIVTMIANGHYKDSLFKDPLFRDAANRDFTLAENSPALDIGFEPWDIAAGTHYVFEK